MTTEPRNNGSRYITWGIVVSALLAALGLLANKVDSANDRWHLSHEAEIKALRAELAAVAKQQAEALIERRELIEQIDLRLRTLETKR